jgi:hypothetical protein
MVAAAALICLLAAACARTPEAPPPVQVDVGIHDVSFQVPEGWEHLDHGRQHRFQRDLSQISATDLGPVATEGYLRELRRAHQLFLDDRLDDAFAHLSGIDLRPAFPDAQRRRAFIESWRKARDGGRSTDVTRHDAVVAWERILGEVERLPVPDLAALVEERFPSIETAAHREIAERSPMQISDRPAVRIETWDRLSHDHRQSFLFVLNQGNLFLLRMELGPFGEVKPAFETLAGSLEFHSPATTS